MFLQKASALPDADSALPGRKAPMPVNNRHYVNERPIMGPMLAAIETAVFGLGCFWGAEQIFWKMQGVYSTAVGYAGGFTPNPDYKEVCSGHTGHTEVVMVFYDLTQTSYDNLLKLFWESHNPTQGMRQGNDRGTQYRSAIYTTSPQQMEAALATRAQFQQALKDAGHTAITTEIKPLDKFYYAEDYHQQYLAKNPDGYCGIGGLGICY
jgi:peptide-methionine (S)-S-oxide reductase